MNHFFLWNNGRSIWNIDQIERMYVTKSPVTNEDIHIIVIGGHIYEISKEEYSKLGDYIRTNPERIYTNLYYNHDR